MDYSNYNWEDCEQPSLYCRTIHQLASGHKKGLEIGFDSGSSALAFLTGALDAKLLSVDVSKREKAIILLEKHGVKHRHELVIKDSKIFLPQLVEKGEYFDYIFIDGGHLYREAKSDLENALRLITDDGVIILDDYEENHGLFKVFEAVEDVFKSEEIDEIFERTIYKNSHTFCIIKRKK